MRALAISLLLCVCGLAWSEGEETKEPKALVVAREKYQRDLKRATDPIVKDYIARLEALKKELGAKGDAEGAMAVQNEIDPLKEAMAVASGKRDPFVGEWIWRDDAGILVVSPNGTAVLGGRNKGTWICLGKGVYKTSFSNGTSHRLVLSPDGKSMDGENIPGGRDVDKFVIRRKPE